MAAAAESDAAKWCTAQLTADDAKIMIPLFEKNGVLSVADVLLLSKEDLTELGVAIGPRNRLIAAQAKAKAPVEAPPVAPKPPVSSVPVKVPYAKSEWNCPACTMQNPIAKAKCEVCGTSNPNAPAAPPVITTKAKPAARTPHMAFAAQQRQPEIARALNANLPPPAAAS